MAEPACGPQRFLPDPQFPPGYNYEEHGENKHILSIDRNLWEDDDEDAIPLKVDLHDLPAHDRKYPQTDASDRKRYNEWEAKEELKYYKPI